MYHRFRNHFRQPQWYSYMTWVKWKLILEHLDTVLFLTQDGCMISAKCTICSKIILDALDYFPRCVDQADAHFELFGDSFNFGARKVHGLHLIYNGHGNRFGHTRWYSYITYVKWKLVSVGLEIVLVLEQDRSMVCSNVP
jgi:hypothetical protein